MKVKNKRLDIGCRPADYKGQKVYCPNSSAIGFNVQWAKPGCWLSWKVQMEDWDGNPYTRQGIGRMFASVHDWKEPGQQGPDTMIGVLTMGSMHEFGMLRWVDPTDVEAISEEPPAEFLAWVMGEGFEEAAKDPAVMLRLIKLGTLSQQHIENVEMRVEEMRQRGLV